MCKENHHRGAGDYCLEILVSVAASGPTGKDSFDAIQRLCTRGCSSFAMK